VSLFSIQTSSHFVDLGSVLLLLTCFAIVAQRQLSVCVNIFALQSVFLAITAALVAFLTGIHHIYLAAVLTIVIKVIIIPRVLRQVIERSDVKQETDMYVNVPTAVLICGALVILAVFVVQPFLEPSFLLTRDSLVIALATMLIGFFIMIIRKRAITQVIGFLVMENGLFLGATAAAYGMPLIVELGIFFDVLVGALVFGVYSNQLQDITERTETRGLTILEEE
jgi:hydrogenase-4 component E